jgi:hypothetical protein
MKLHLTVILALAACCASCSSYGHDHADLQLSAAESNPSVKPRTVDLDNHLQLDEVTGLLAEKACDFHRLGSR